MGRGSGRKKEQTFRVVSTPPTRPQADRAEKSAAAAFPVVSHAVLSVPDPLPAIPPPVQNEVVASEDAVAQTALPASHAASTVVFGSVVLSIAAAFAAAVVWLYGTAGVRMEETQSKVEGVFRYGAVRWNGRVMPVVDMPPEWPPVLVLASETGFTTKVPLSSTERILPEDEEMVRSIPNRFGTPRQGVGPSYGARQGNVMPYARRPMQRQQGPMTQAPEQGMPKLPSPYQQAPLGGLRPPAKEGR